MLESARIERRIGVTTGRYANEECSHHSQDYNCSDRYKIKSDRPEPRGLALVCRFKCSGCGRFVQRYHCGHGSAHKHEGKRRADNTKEQMMWLRPSTPHILCARPHTIFRSPHIP